MKTRKSTMRFPVLPVLLALATGLSACESTPSPEATGAPESVSDSVPSGQSTGKDPVARYALSAAPGDSAQLQLDNGRQVFVTVGSMYTSAAGVRCRRITLRTQRDASRVSAVCKQDGGWQTVLEP